MNEGKITLDSFRTRRTNMVSDSTIERLFMKIKTGDYLSRLLWKVLSIVNDTFDEGNRFCVLNAIFIVPSEVPAI